MFYGFYGGRGYGRGGGGGMGFGFRGSSPPWPYVGRGRGGLPRCAYYLGGTAASFPRTFQAGMPYDYAARITPEDELSSLKAQAEVLRNELKAIEAEIKELSSAGKSKE